MRTHISKQIISIAILAVLALSLLSSFATIPTAKADVTSNLVAYWGLDEGQTTTVTDYTGTGNNGSWSGSAAWSTTSKYGDAGLFTGSNFITVTDTTSLSPSTSVSLTAWFNPTVAITNTTNTGIIGKYSDYTITIESGELRFTVWDNAGSGANSKANVSLATLNIPTNTWSFVTGTFTGGVAKLYFNGALVSTGNTVASSIRDSGNATYIGKRGDGVGTISSCYIDECRVYSRALSDSDVTSLYTTAPNYGYVYFTYNGFDDGVASSASMLINCNITTSGLAATSVSFSTTSTWGHVLLIGPTTWIPATSYTGGVVTNNTLIPIATTSSNFDLVQMFYNSSSLTTRVYELTSFSYASGNTNRVQLNVPNIGATALVYDFSITNFGSQLTNVYISVTSPAGYTVEKKAAAANLDFVMQEFQTYIMTMTCDQGTYSQSFQAGTVTANSFTVTSANFPTNTTGTVSLTASRPTASQITASLNNPNSTSTWFYVTLSHNSKIDNSIVIDYQKNFTVSGTTYSTTLTVDNTTDYSVNLVANQGSAILNYTYVKGVPITFSNPFEGTFAIFGMSPNGIDFSQIICMAIILGAMLIGSVKHVGFTCIIGVIMAGLLYAIGWFIVSVPILALSGFLAVLFAVQEARENRSEI